MPLTDKERDQKQKDLTREYATEVLKLCRNFIDQGYHDPHTCDVFADKLIRKGNELRRRSWPSKPLDEQQAKSITDMLLKTNVIEWHESYKISDLGMSVDRYVVLFRLRYQTVYQVISSQEEWAEILLGGLEAKYS